MYNNTYEEIGNKVTSGCLRTTCGAAAWIFYNCPIGTTVEIVSGSPQEPRAALLRLLKYRGGSDRPRSVRKPKRKEKGTTEETACDTGRSTADGGCTPVGDPQAATLRPAARSAAVTHSGPSEATRLRPPRLRPLRCPRRSKLYRHPGRRRRQSANQPSSASDDTIIGTLEEGRRRPSSIRRTARQRYCWTTERWPRESTSCGWARSRPSKASLLHLCGRDPSRSTYTGWTKTTSTPCCCTRGALRSAKAA